MKKTAVIIIMFCATACSYKKETLQPACSIDPNVSFAVKVNPVITNSCLSCHNNGFLSGNISLQGYDNIRKTALNGSLYGAINHNTGFSQMPKGNTKLDDCTVASIKKWIDNGAPNN